MPHAPDFVSLSTSLLLSSTFQYNMLSTLFHNAFNQSIFFTDILCLLEAENTGIISTAIANAEKLPAHSGQENLSLLQQHPTNSETATSQFTFTCDSQVPGGIAWPGIDRRHTVSGDDVTAVTRETAPRLSAPATYAPSAASGRHMADQASQSTSAKPSGSAQPPPAPSQPKKTRKQLNMELAQAAKDRRREKLIENRHNPPDDKDIWICEFCEYEAIFKEPPKALIRKYELNARKARKQEEERRRLLQKAKERSRKGKKSNKPAPAKNNNLAQESTTHHADANAPPSDQLDGHGAEGDEHYDEEEYEPCLQQAELPATVEERHSGGDGAQGHRPLRPPTASRSDTDIPGPMEN
jgi:hypothetical protein